MRRFLLKDFSLGIYIMTAAIKRACTCAKHFCFYNSIKYAFGDYALSPMTWTTPSGMKQFLKIGIDDPILMSSLSMLSTLSF